MGNHSCHRNENDLASMKRHAWQGHSILRTLGEARNQERRSGENLKYYQVDSFSGLPIDQPNFSGHAFARIIFSSPVDPRPPEAGRAMEDSGNFAELEVAGIAELCCA